MFCFVENCESLFTGAGLNDDISPFSGSSHQTTCATHQVDSVSGGIGTITVGSHLVSRRTMLFFV